MVGTFGVFYSWEDKALLATVMWINVEITLVCKAWSWGMTHRVKTVTEQA